MCSDAGVGATHRGSSEDYLEAEKGLLPRRAPDRARTQLDGFGEAPVGHSQRSGLLGGADPPSRTTLEHLGHRRLSRCPYRSKSGLRDVPRMGILTGRKSQLRGEGTLRTSGAGAAYPMFRCLFLRLI